MPATRRNSTTEPSSTIPYSLSGAPKSQLTALTVAALKSHLKHFKLPVAGRKSELVDRLHSRLLADNPTDTQYSDTSNSQQGALPEDTPTDARTDAEPQRNAPDDNVPTLPQQLFDQLSTFLQPARNNASGDATCLATPQPNAREDDRLSAASVQVRPNPPLPMQVLPIRPAIQDGDPSGVLTLTPSLLQPTLPAIPAKIQERIARGEYIDFIILLSKSMFGAPEGLSQTLTLQLNPSGDKLFHSFPNGHG